MRNAEARDGAERRAAVPGGHQSSDARPRRTPPKLPRPAPAPVCESPLIGALEQRIREAAGDERAAIVAEFWAGRTSPMIEPAERADEAIVTFLWRDATAEAVLLFANRLTDERNLDASLMQRIPETDIRHLSYRMGADWRASYCFVPQRAGERAPWLNADDQVAIRAALDHGAPDPLNSVRIRNRAGREQSICELPDAPPQPWRTPREGVPRGIVTEATAPDGRAAWFYRPTVPLDESSPLVVVLDGEVWVPTDRLPATLDNLIADGEIPPTAAVFVDSISTATRWDDLERGSAFERMLTGSLLDWARNELGVSRRADRTIIAGQSLGGLSALRCVLEHPDRAGLALSTSASLWLDDLAESIAGEAATDARCRIEVGTQEWVLLEPHRALASALRERGVALSYREYNGGHDYACWQVAFADGLRELLGPR